MVATASIAHRCHIDSGSSDWGGEQSRGGTGFGHNFIVLRQSLLVGLCGIFQLPRSQLNVLASSIVEDGSSCGWFRLEASFVSLWLVLARLVDLNAVVTGRGSLECLSLLLCCFLFSTFLLRLLSSYIRKSRLGSWRLWFGGSSLLVWVVSIILKRSSGVLVELLHDICCTVWVESAVCPICGSTAGTYLDVCIFESMTESSTDHF